MTGTAYKLPASLLDDSPAMIISDIVQFSDQTLVCILMTNYREKFIVKDGRNIGDYLRRLPEMSYIEVT